MSDLPSRRSIERPCTECGRTFIAVGGLRGPLPAVCSVECKYARKARVVAESDRPRSRKARCVQCGARFTAKAGRRGPFEKTCGLACRLERLREAR